MRSKPEISLRKKLIFSFLIVIILFAFIEGVLRWIGLPHHLSTRARREMMWNRKGVERDVTLPWSWIPIPNGLCVFDARNAFRFNSQGFRGAEVQKVKPDGTYRIVCMGDSCTMGWQVNDNSTFCARLAPLLAKMIAQRVETINAGVLGYATSQGLHQLRTRILPLHPDLIIASYNWNDHSPAIDIEGSHPDRELPRRAFLLFRFEHFFSGLRIVQSLENLTASLHPGSTNDFDGTENTSGPEPIPTVLRVPVEDYIQNWMEFIQITKQNHVTLVLMTQPFKVPKRQDPDMEFLIQKQREYNRALIRIAMKTGTPIVDPSPDFHAHGKPGELFSSIVHPTEIGHELIAQKLADTISNLRK